MRCIDSLDMSSCKAFLVASIRREFLLFSSRLQPHLLETNGLENGVTAQLTPNLLLISFPVISVIFFM